jgi:anhydro-N-acetylmuramic acid kinase
MSGTSLDGVDGVLAGWSGPQLHVVASASAPMPAPLRSELLALNTPTDNELHRAARAGHALTAIYAQVVEDLLRQAPEVPRETVSAIGAHGQTVRHQPQKLSDDACGAGYTLQLGSPALLAECTRITVVADFRSRDIAAGGQGAPLVPAFHQHLFGHLGAVAVLNVGGMANLTVLPADPQQPVIGFDCGPGNVLMDAWCQAHLGQPFDADGAWAATGTVIEPLLTLLLREPFLHASPPKSTGRDLFSPTWLYQHLDAFGACRAQDVQATLQEFTARACAQQATRDASGSHTLVVCGGGAFNGQLLRRLRAHLPGWQVQTSERYGLAPQWVEATAFAWLARQTLHGLPGNLAQVTGAKGPRVLGAIYPA